MKYTISKGKVKVKNKTSKTIKMKVKVKSKTSKTIKMKVKVKNKTSKTKTGHRWESRQFMKVAVMEED